MPEIGEVVLWDPNPLLVARTALAPRPKVMLITADLDRALDQADLRFALVCVSHDQSSAVAHRAIEAGFHLLSEKLGAGTLGELTSIEARFLATQVRFRNPSHWLFQRQYSGGGILLWLGCHCLDLLHRIPNDEITEVSGFLATRSGEAIDVEDTATLALKFRSGAIGTFHSGYSLAFSGKGYVNAKGYDSYTAFNGRKGRVIWPSLDPQLQIEAPAPENQSAIRQESFNLPDSTSYGGVLGEVFFRWFIASTEGRAQPPTTLADALRTARAIEAAELSSQTGKSVKVVYTPANPALNR